LRLADVFLDTFPYNCGSTTNDVVQAGVPIITVSGKTLVSRMGGSILKSLGLSQLIATNLSEYKTKIAELADPQNPTHQALKMQALTPRDTGHWQSDCFKHYFANSYRALIDANPAFENGFTTVIPSINIPLCIPNAQDRIPCPNSGRHLYDIGELAILLHWLRISKTKLYARAWLFCAM
jgi:hypothetical protein